MIDTAALCISHGLMLAAAWALLRRRDLDDERPEADRAGRGQGRWPRA